MVAELLKKDELMRKLLYVMEFGGEKYRIVQVIEVWFVSKRAAVREFKTITTDDTMVGTLNKAMADSGKGDLGCYKENRIEVVTNGVSFFRLGESILVWEPTLDSVEERAPMISGFSEEERFILGLPDPVPFVSAQG